MATNEPALEQEGKSAGLYEFSKENRETPVDVKTPLASLASAPLMGHAIQFSIPELAPWG